MARVHQVALISCTLALSWLLMMAMHEAGHVLHAWVSGGRVDHVELRPWTISRTDVGRNPHPLFVAWGGPIWGCLLPLSVWLAARLVRFRFDYLLRFFAGFCLIANGAYIGIGAVVGVGDAGDMLRHGCPVWAAVVFGFPAIACGLYLWHGLGPHFGLKDTTNGVDAAAVWFVGSALAIVVLAETVAHWLLT
jgi:hypothetical protein